MHEIGLLLTADVKKKGTGGLVNKDSQSKG